MMAFSIGFDELLIENVKKSEIESKNYVKHHFKSIKLSEICIHHVKKWTD